MRKLNRIKKYTYANRSKHGGIWVRQGAGIHWVMWNDSILRNLYPLREALDYADYLVANPISVPFDTMRLA